MARIVLNSAKCKIILTYGKILCTMSLQH